MTALIALALKIGGVGFLFVAAIGVMRFSDAFQRMHAATKAGTLGAGLVILGTIVSNGTIEGSVIGVLTIVFLLMTVPVAGHMLGRAAYVSGANMEGLRGPNALDGVLERQSRPLEDRLFRTSSQSADSSDTLSNLQDQDDNEHAAWGELNDLSEVRFAVIDGYVEAVYSRAYAISRTNRAHLTAYTLVDQLAVDTSRSPEAARSDIRDRATRAMARLEALKGNRQIKLGIIYDEGNPEILLSCNEAPGASLLVLPREGWFHHGNNHPRPGMSWEPDGLLRLPAVHGGPVLYVGNQKEEHPRIVVYDDGEPHLAEALHWALRNRIWNEPKIVVVGNEDSKRFDAFSSISSRFGIECEHASSTVKMPAFNDARGIILGQVPSPRRARWYGQAWYDRLIPNYKGDILIIGGDGLNN